MRIHFISSEIDVLPAPDGAGWSGRVGTVLGLADALAREGHEVAVVCLQADGPDRQDVRPGLTVHTVRSGSDAAALRDRVLRLWDSGAPDVVHALDRLAGLAVADPAAAAGAVLVQSLATVDPPGAGPDADDVLLHRAERVVADSEAQLDDLLRRGVPRPRLRIVPPGVDTDVWTTEGESLRRNKSPRIVVIGSLEPDGGADDAVAALRYAPDVELYLGGGPAPGLEGDPDLLRLQELAARTGVLGRVRFLGAVGRENAGRLLRSADVVVCPSRRGGGGTSVLEAMACGRPVVATAVGCQRDIVVDGVTGVRVRPGRATELGTTVRGVLSDPTGRQASGIAGRDRVLARYAWTCIARTAASVYDEAIHELHPAPEALIGSDVEDTPTAELTV